MLFETILPVQKNYSNFIRDIYEIEWKRENIERSKFFFFIIVYYSTVEFSNNDCFYIFLNYTKK